MLSKSNMAWRWGFAQNLGNANTVKSQFEAVSIKQSTIALFCSLTISTLFLYTSEACSAEHVIQLKSEETGDDGFGNKLLAYKMVEHKVDGADITDRYSSEATIPGPTLFLTEEMLSKYLFLMRFQAMKRLCQESVSR